MTTQTSIANDVTIRAIDVHQAAKLVESGEAVLIDVREFIEYEDEHIPGAALYPLSTYDTCNPDGDRDKIGIFHCRSGRRTAEHFSRFLNAGFKEVVHMAGGIVEWSIAGYPIRSLEDAPADEVLLPCQKVAA